MLEFFEPELHPVYEFYMMNSYTIRQYVKDHWEEGYNNGDLMRLIDEAIDFSMNDEIIEVLRMSVSFVDRLLRPMKVRQAISENCNKRTFYLVTFTSDPLKSEYENMVDIDRFRLSHFKKYKHCFVSEKESAENKKYHVHVLIECPLRVVHTKQNLKPVKYYKGNVNVQKVTPTKPSILRIVKDYFTKENKPKGDVDYFLNIDI